MAVLERAVSGAAVMFFAATFFAATFLMGVAFFMMASVAVADVRLIMFERQGCLYCLKWKAQIGPIYPKTAEGRIAPLTILNMDAPLPAGLHLASRPSLSPTFVLLDNQQEQARIEGYPGEEMFWWMMDAMIQKLPAAKQRDPGS